VTVNGRAVTELGERADAERDVITVDGERVASPAARRTIALHKPRGVVSTLEDPEGRATVAGLLGRGLPRLYPIGRLDLNTSGLLLLTNDGALAAGLLHPRREVDRIYRAKVRGAVSAEALTRLRRGVRLEDGKTAPARVTITERLPTKTWLEVTVREGRSHLVRRMCDAVGNPVEKLIRIRVGPVGLGTLPPGAWREVNPRDLALLRAAAGVSGGSPGGAGDRAYPRGARGTPPRRRRPPPASRSRDEARTRGSAGAAPKSPARRRNPKPRRP
jgi:23S rRNA pseudouridine2605 synthase